MANIKIYPSISNSNTKLGTFIGSVNMPQGVTCPADAPCRKGCYATRGNFNYSNVKEGIYKNYLAYMENPQQFFDVLHWQLNMLPYRFFRWHGSGDIVDARYLEGMCWLAEQHPNTKFLCFTKQYKIVNDYLNEHEKPMNLTIVFSNWMDYIAPNPHNLPMTYVEFKGADFPLPENALRCSGKCATCVNTEGNCWNLKNGDSVIMKKH